MKNGGLIVVVVTLLIGFVFLGILVTNRNNQVYKDIKLPVEMEVFVDYNCTHCDDFAPTVIDVKNQFGDKLNVVQKNLPFLSNGKTPDTSTLYANATEAARLQNKYWEYSEALFKSNFFTSKRSNPSHSYTQEEVDFFTANPQTDVDKLAEFVGLDVDKFKEDRQSEEVMQTVKSQKEDAIKRLGAAATPAVFIFGQKYELSSKDDLIKEIQSLIDKVESQNK